MGGQSHILSARTFLVLAGICSYFAYNILLMPGLAGLNGLCFAMLAVGCVVAAIGCSVDSYDEWAFNLRVRAVFGRA